MIRGINHITLAVVDLDTSLRFYNDVLGAQAHVRWQHGAYLTLGNMWLCLSVDPDRAITAVSATDYTHLALDVAPEHYEAACQRLRDDGVEEWRDNRSEGKSLYFLDPDRHRLEMHCGSLQSRLASLKAKPYEGLQWLTPIDEKNSAQG